MIDLYLYLASFQPLLGRATALEMVWDCLRPSLWDTSRGP